MNNQKIIDSLSILFGLLLILTLFISSSSSNNQNVIKIEQHEQNNDLNKNEIILPLIKNEVIIPLIKNNDQVGNSFIYNEDDGL